ncbi:hypothetical protein KP13_03093 (plasmid) [Klebsiella pneumoniae subsp. pneumoniae Kp13]|nr:hypothetical protein KP13_03093 [Klebsiella pneumoniae subsp. pneumoniae Kp13]
MSGFASLNSRKFLTSLPFRSVEIKKSAVCFIFLPMTEPFLKLDCTVLFCKSFSLCGQKSQFGKFFMKVTFTGCLQWVEAFN